MRNVLGVATYLLIIPGVLVIWDLLMIPLLRRFKVHLPWSFPIHIWDRRERDLQAALKGMSVAVHVFVSGILLLSFPVIAGLELSDFLNDRYLGLSPYRDQHPYGLDAPRIVGSLVALIVIGLGVGITVWKRSVRKIASTDSMVEGGAR